jgi:hypothetical protein
MEGLKRAKVKSVNYSQVTVIQQDPRESPPTFLWSFKDAAVLGKGPNKWRLINEGVIPLHPIVPNPYTLLAQIPSKAQYYSILDLKDTFFCIPLHPDSQPLFAFEDPTNLSQQLTWTVLPQGFRDSPHLFGQTLTRDLLDWHYPEDTLLQYVDDLLLCRATEPLICRLTGSFLNFLASEGHKVSKEKAQLCLPQVTYLSVVLKGQTRSLSHKRINLVLCFPLPHTIKQLGAFLGVAGFCRVWIPRYAALARPLFVLLLIFLFGSCIINDFCRFISQQVQQIKL